jgi:hypothetical protein
MRTSFTFKLLVNKAVLRLRLTAAEYAQCLKYYGCDYQLHLHSGIAYSQGNGWYEVHLKDDKFAVEVASERFMACVAVAINRADEILKAKRETAVRLHEVRQLQLQTPKRVHVVDVYRGYRGKPEPVVRSRVLSAVLNRHHELVASLRSLTPSTPAPASSLAALAQHYAH